MVSKGSVAVDGISLTVNECRRDRFSVAIIPFTLRHTNLRARKVGAKVNIETDLTAATFRENEIRVRVSRANAELRRLTAPSPEGPNR